jgi:hypothetical protein
MTIDETGLSTSAASRARGRRSASALRGVAQREEDHHQPDEAGPHRDGGAEVGLDELERGHLPAPSPRRTTAEHEPQQGHRGHHAACRSRRPAGHRPPSGWYSTRRPPGRFQGRMHKGGRCKGLRSHRRTASYHEGTKARRERPGSGGSGVLPAAICAICGPFPPLLDGHALRQIPRLIDLAVEHIGHVIGVELHRMPASTGRASSVRGCGSRRRRTCRSPHHPRRDGDHLAAAHGSPGDCRGLLVVLPGTTADITCGSVTRASGRQHLPAA